SLQTDRYATYHITDPGDFYAKEDAWSVANDPTAAANNVGSQPPVPPYYVLMKLPDSKGLDFALVRPFTPNNRQNMTAYMVAHSDPADYGQLVTYRLSHSDASLRPHQLQRRINQDPPVRPQ